MIRLSYATPEEAHQSRRSLGWLAQPDGTYRHNRALATIDGSTVIISVGTLTLIAEVAEVIKESAALREECEYDRGKRA